MSGKKQGGSSSEATSIFCGNIGFNTTEETVRKFFAKTGTVKSVRIALDEEGRVKGFCHVEFATAAMANDALKLNGQEIDGRACRLALS